MPSSPPSEDPIQRWALELKSLKSAAAIRRFRQRFDKATAQAIIKSPELSTLDRGCISLALAFAAPEPGRFGVHHDAEIITLDEPDLELPIPSAPDAAAPDGNRRQPGPPQPSGAQGATGGSEGTPRTLFRLQRWTLRPNLHCSARRCSAPLRVSPP